MNNNEPNFKGLIFVCLVRGKIINTTIDRPAHLCDTPGGGGRDCKERRVIREFD